MYSRYRLFQTSFIRWGLLFRTHRTHHLSESQAVQHYKISNANRNTMVIWVQGSFNESYCIHTSSVSRLTVSGSRFLRVAGFCFATMQFWISTICVLSVALAGSPSSWKVFSTLLAEWRHGWLARLLRRIHSFVLLPFYTSYRTLQHSQNREQLSFYSWEVNSANRKLVEQCVENYCYSEDSDLFGCL